MKVCPQCQASFAEGYVYCPQDHTELERFDLRGAVQRMHRQQKMQQRELRLLLPHETFWQRLRCELRFAQFELRTNPRAFLRELWRGEPSSRRRVMLLQSGAAVAVISYTALFTLSILLGLLGWLPQANANEVVAVLERNAELDFANATPLFVPLVATRKPVSRAAAPGHLGGSLQLPKPQRAQGGGSGGERNRLPASGGVSARPSLQPQIILPSPYPSNIKQPVLPVTPTVLVDPRSMKWQAGTIGLLGAPPAPPSKGPGERGGIGNNKGKGIGPAGDGDGLGPGKGFNTGGHDPRLGSDRTTGPGSDNRSPRMATSKMRPTITFKEKARYTEEARQAKIEGTVSLVATFTADGRITDIRVVRGLPSGLSESAVQAAQRIRFIPAQVNGQSVSVRAQLEFTFNLY